MTRAELLRTINTDDFIWRAPGESKDAPGIALHAGETVTILTYIPSSTMRAILSWQSAGLDIQTIETEGKSEEQAAAILKSNRQNIERMLTGLEIYCALSEQIIDWTWTDPVSGEALAKPHKNPDVFGKLDHTHLSYLAGLVMRAGRNPNPS